MCIEVVLVDIVGDRRNFTLFLTCNGNGDGNGNADAGVSRIAKNHLHSVKNLKTTNLSSHEIAVFT